MENKKYKLIKNCYCNGCYILGPTGPTGPQGPVTVKVNNTITGLEGTNAMVINKGTEENVVLDFIIPRGNTGPAPILEIGNIITGKPGTEASVIITPIDKNNN